jgi:hypothetical protein
MAQVASFVQQAGIYFSGSTVLEALTIQHLEHFCLFNWRQSSGRRRASPNLCRLKGTIIAAAGHFQSMTGRIYTHLSG